MSKKFLSPIKLAQGATNPAVGSEGELFWNTADLKVYVHNGTSWAASGGAFTMSPTAPTSPAPKHGDPWLDTSDGSLYVFYDDGSGITSTRTNLLGNPSFETNLSNWFSAPAANTLARVTSTSFVGTACLEMTYSSGNTYIGTTGALANIDPGQSITFSVYVKDVNTSTQHQATIEFYDGGDTLWGTATGTAVAISSSSWTRISVSGTAPANTAYATLQVKPTSTPANGTKIYLDAALLESGLTLGSYFDGSSVGGSWSGTPNLSTSTIPGATQTNTGQWIQIQTTSAINSELANRATALESSVTTLQTQTAGFEADVIALDARADSLESRATAVESRATNLEARTYSPNYIINGGMDIWQRGTTGTITAGSGANFASADRWKFGSFGAAPAITATRSTDVPTGVGVTYSTAMSWASSTSNGDVFATQYVEGGKYLFAGKTVTISFYAKAASPITTGAAFDQDYAGTNFSITTSWARYSWTVTLPSNYSTTYPSGAAGWEHSELRLFRLANASAAANTIYFTGVQIEDGPTTTPFRRSAPSIQAELATCQRYCYVKNHDGLDLMWGWGRWESNTFYCVFQHPVRMRALPSFTLVTPTGLQVVDPTVAWYTVSAINSIHKNGVSASDINFTMSGASVTNKTFGIMAVNSGTPKLIVSAEM